jgi:hypothetical protein
MNVLPSLSGINRGEFSGRVLCYSPSFHVRELKLKHHFSCLLSGLSGSGKSSFLIRFLRKFKAFCNDHELSGGIIWCYVRVTPSSPGSWPGRNTTVFTKECQQTLRTLGKTVPHNPRRFFKRSLFKEVCDLFTKGSHHRNISVILITQNLFHHRRYSRGL